MKSLCKALNLACKSCYLQCKTVKSSCKTLNLTCEPVNLTCKLAKTLEKRRKLLNRPNFQGDGGRFSFSVGRNVGKRENPLHGERVWCRERNRLGCTVSRLAEWNLRELVALRKESGGMPNTAGGTPALPAQRLEFGLGCGSTMMPRLRRLSYGLFYHRPIYFFVRFSFCLSTIEFIASS